MIGEALRLWNPDLVICSDAQAPSNLVDREKFFPTHPESHAAALKAGVDSYTGNGPDPRPTIQRFTAALEQGLIVEQDIDAAVQRILAMRARTGEFDPAVDPYAGIRADAIACPEHNALALEAARAALVWLKNENGALPLPIQEDSLDPRRHPVAVIGHLGSRVLTDWYSGTLPYVVSIADGLRMRFSGTVTAVDGAVEPLVVRHPGDRPPESGGVAGGRGRRHVAAASQNRLRLLHLRGRRRLRGQDQSHGHLRTAIGDRRCLVVTERHPADHGAVRPALIPVSASP